MILERIIVSTKEPLNKNVLWVDGADIKYWGPNGWSGLDVTENDKLWTSIQEEIKDREDADIAITEKLDKEIQDRIDAITTITEALNKEVSDRQEADTSLEERLNQRIDDEIADKEEGYTGLTNKLNQEIADRKAADTAIQTDLDTFKSTKGEASGLAPLNESGKVDSQYLPSFVDDVVDVYATYDKDEVGNLTNIQLYSDPEHQNPITGEAGKIYQNIAEDEPAYQFRWTGTIFTTTGSTGLIIGEVTGTAYDGGKGKHTTDVVNSIPSGMISDLSRTPGSDSMDINMVKYIRGGDGTFTQDIPRTVNIPAATKSTAGVMSSADKQKLDGLKEGTELETELQEITEDITNLSDKVGSNTYTDANYISKETNLTDATLQLDEEIKATNDNLAILNAATVKSIKVGSNTNNEAFSSGVITIANATTSTDGALSKEVYNSLSSFSYITSFGSAEESTSSLNYPIRLRNIANGTTSGNYLTIPVATTSNIGLMSKTDKTKLDNIEDTYLPLSGGSITGTLSVAGNTTLGNVTITGNVTQQGDSFITEAETVQVKDNLLVLNNGEVGAGVTAGISGIEVDRGTETNYQFIFDESDDYFKVGEVGNLQTVLTRDTDANLTNNKFFYWDNTTKQAKTRDVAISDISGLQTDGDGSLYLANDGTYKDVSASSEQEIYTIVPSETANTANASVYTLLKNNSNIVVVYKDNSLFFPISWKNTVESSTFLGSAVIYDFLPSEEDLASWTSYNIDLTLEGVCHCTQNSLLSSFAPLCVNSFIYSPDNTGAAYNAQVYLTVNSISGYAVVTETEGYDGNYNKHIGKLTKTPDNITIVCTEGNKQITYVCTPDGNITKQEADITIDWSNIESKPTIPSAYTLPIASTDTLGGIKVGGGLTINSSGVLSATGGGVADSVDIENVAGLNSSWLTLLQSAPSRYVTTDPTWEQVTGKPEFATVATTGSYNDLTNKPTIPSLSGYATQTWANSQFYPLNGKGHLSFDISGRPVMANNQGYSFKRADGSLLEALFVSPNNELVIGGTSSNYVTDIKLNCTNLINKSGATYLNTDNIGTITFTGAVSATFDGTNDITVNIPTAGGGVADSVDWSNVTNKPTWIGSTKPTYSYSEITGTMPIATETTVGGIKSSVNARAGEAREPIPAGEYHVMVSSTGLAYVQLPEWVEGEDAPFVKWNDITGKPIYFTPSPHTHPLNEIENLGFGWSTSLTSVLYTKTVFINGESTSFFNGTSDRSVTIWSPSTAGADGEILVSTGRTPTWKSISSVIGTGFVTIDTAQTITGAKTFTAYTIFSNGAGTSSDKRLTRSIKPIENPFEILEGLTGYRYTLISNNAKSAGLIAQDVEKVLPEAVRTDDEGYKSVDTYPIVAVLVETIKELKKEIEELKSKL